METPASVSRLPASIDDDEQQPASTYASSLSHAPPAGLSREGKKWWREITDEYSISDSGGLLLLRTALEALDRMRQAQRAIKQEGATLLDRFGQAKPHPLLVIERDSRAQMIMALKALNLDVIPLHDRPGRPGGS